MHLMIVCKSSTDVRALYGQLRAIVCKNCQFTDVRAIPTSSVHVQFSCNLFFDRAIHVQLFFKAFKFFFFIFSPMPFRLMIFFLIEPST